MCRKKVSSNLPKHEVEELEALADTVLYAQILRLSIGLQNLDVANLALIYLRPMMPMRKSKSGKMWLSFSLVMLVPVHETGPSPLNQPQQK